MNSRICLIGFGEVGQALAADLRAVGHDQISAFDSQFADPASAPCAEERGCGSGAVASRRDGGCVTGLDD